jgi:CRP/FNR family cyclic AMP-dependent transcriptional regulator
MHLYSRYDVLSLPRRASSITGELTPKPLERAADAATAPLCPTMALRALCDVLPQRRSDVYALIKMMSLRTFGAGEALWHQGDAPSFLAVVEHGELAVILDFEGRQKTIETVITGGMVGEFGALCGRQRHASVKCTDTHPIHTLACLDVATINELEPPLLAALQAAALQFLSQRMNLYSLRTHFLD